MHKSTLNAMRNRNECLWEHCPDLRQVFVKARIVVNSWFVYFLSSGMSVRISWPFVSVIIFDVLSFRFLSCLNRCPSEPVVVGGGTEDSANNATHSRIGLDLLCRLQTLALEAGLVAFETGSGCSEGLAISTVVRGIWAFCQIDNHDTVFHGG